MKNKFLSVFLIVALVAAACAFTACKSSDDDVYLDLERTSAVAVFDMGVQDVTVAFDGKSSSTFKKTVSKNDVELGGALAGITISGVKFVDEKTITISLAGAAKKRADNSTGTITVKPSGKNGKGKSVCYVTVCRPALLVVGCSRTSASKDGVTTYSTNAHIKIDAGSFIAESITGNVRLADGEEGTLDVSLDADGVLRVSVKDGKVGNPKVVFGAGATTFGKEVELSLEELASVEF